MKRTKIDTGEIKKTVIKWDMNIDYYSNGCGVIIKRRKDKKVWARVFYNSDKKEMDKWIKDVKEGKYE